MLPRLFFKPAVHASNSRILLLIGKKILTNTKMFDCTCCVASLGTTAFGEKSSNSAAFSLARATTLSGKFANSAT